MHKQLINQMLLVCQRLYLEYESLNKDQYRATLDVNQLIYNGGMIDANAKFKEAQTQTSTTTSCG